MGIVLGLVLIQGGNSAAISQSAGLLKEIHDEQHAWQREFKASLDTLGTEQKEIRAKVEGLVLGREAIAPELMGLPEPPTGMVTVKLSWDHKRVPGEFLLFTQPPDSKQWDTRAVGPGVEVKTGQTIKDGILFLRAQRGPAGPVCLAEPPGQAPELFRSPTYHQSVQAPG